MKARFQGWLTDAEVLAAIRANHLTYNIAEHERNSLVSAGQHATVHWDRAHLDPGGTVFGPGPYAKVPITLRFDPPLDWSGLDPRLKDFNRIESDEITVRVYPPARLRRKLAPRWMVAPHLYLETQ